MKKSLFSFLILITLLSRNSLLNAQTNTFPTTGSVGIGTTAPSSSSILDIQSTNKGVLFPRMTKAQRDAIASPVEGLVIYQTDATPGYYYYTTGGGWVEMTQKGATKRLNNLVGTQINVDLLPNADNARSLGSTPFSWKDIYMDGKLLVGGNVFMTEKTGVSDGYTGYNVCLGRSAGSSMSGLAVDNVAIGTEALTLNTTGTSNTAVGQDALSLNTTGTENTAVGAIALSANGTASRNTAVGYGALQLTNAADNTAVGHSALFNNINGAANVAIGSSALYANSGGGDNIGVGYQSLYSNTTGIQNIGIGSQSLFSNTSGNNNLAIGKYAMYYTTGSNNLSLGNNALFYNTSGNNNIALGIGSQFSNISGERNIAIGNNTLVYNASTSYNIAIGDSAMYNFTSVIDPIWGEQGGGNIAVGANAAKDLRGEGGSVIIGKDASRYYSEATANAWKDIVSANYGNYGQGGNVLVGVGSAFKAINAETVSVGPYAGLYRNGLGSVFIGSQFYTGGEPYGFSNTVAAYDVAIGYNSYVNRSSYNAIAIGNLAYASGNNLARIGNSEMMSIGGFVNWTDVSDQRVKTNVKENVPGLEFINQLRPVTYTMDMDAVMKMQNGGDPNAMGKAQKQSIEAKSKVVYTGFLAQEVEKAAESLHYDFSGVDKPQSEDQLYGLRYAEFVVPLVKAAQELDSTNKALEATIADQQSQLDLMNQRMSALEALLGTTQDNGSGASGSNVQAVVLSGNDIPVLGQNKPNPFSGTTSIQYYVPPTCSSAQLKIASLNGVEYRNIELSKGNGTIVVDASQMPSGAYVYSLIVDGKTIDSRQMVLNK